MLCCRFLARWGVVFESVKFIVQKPQQLKASPAGTSQVVLERNRHVIQLFGTLIMLMKIVLYAELLAGMAKGDMPLLQVVLVLSVTLLYWAYLRLFAPLIMLSELVIETVAAICDAVTLIFALVVVLLPFGSFNTLYVS